MFTDSTDLSLTSSELDYSTFYLCSIPGYLINFSPQLTVMGTVFDESNWRNVIYKTKPIVFFGKTVPIILQDDNDSSALVAICNVLLLRNVLTLDPEVSEVALPELLFLLSEKLGEEHKGEDLEYSEEKTIFDAPPLLRSFITDLKINVRFTDIHDFDFTHEFKIFHSLNIELVHGWLYDPEDEVTSKAIGHHSYNTLVEKLTALETHQTDFVDLAAAIADTLGVPSPSSEILKKAMPITETQSIHDLDPMMGNDDLCQPQSLDNCQRHSEASKDLSNNVKQLSPEAVNMIDNKDVKEKDEASASVELSGQLNYDATITDLGQGMSHDDYLLSGEDNIQSQNKEVKDMEQNADSQISYQQQIPIFDGAVFDTCSARDILDIQTPVFPKTCLVTPQDVKNALKCKNVLVEQDCLPDENNVVEPDKSCELLYEGEAEAGLVDQNGIPLKCRCRRQATQENGILRPLNSPGRNGSTEAGEGKVIQNFLKENESQLTYYGFLCLKEFLKDQELYVFFCKNRFKTMFKYNKNLYLLVTEHESSSQTNVVWKRLNEVDQDSLFLTAEFVPI